MSKHTKTTTVNVPMCVASVLFCLTLISFHLMGGLYAKYTAGSARSDSARVITFGELALLESGDFGADGKWMIIPGVDLQKKAEITFEGSESATYIFVEVVVSSAWITSDQYHFTVKSGDKTVMQWEMADGWEIVSSDSQGTYVYYRHLAPNKSLEADVIADNGKISVSDQMTKSEIGNMTGISIGLRASVVQSIGFESPAAAWESIAAKE